MRLHDEHPISERSTHSIESPPRGFGPWCYTLVLHRNHELGKNNGLGGQKPDIVGLAEASHQEGELGIVDVMRGRGLGVRR